MEHEPNTVLTWPVVIQRVAMGIAATVVVGAGGMVISNNTRASVHEQRIEHLEIALQTLPTIDKNLVALSGKVDVLNQKIDDMKSAKK